jgi:hypothetical protein
MAIYSLAFCLRGVSNVIHVSLPFPWLVKRTVREADDLSPSSVAINNPLSYTSISPYVFVALCVMVIRLSVVQPVKIKLSLFLIKHHAFKAGRGVSAIFDLGTRWR